MDESPKEILNFIAENDVKFIRLTFCDMQGNLKNIAIMPSELERAFSYGILLDAASFSGCYEDLLLVPDAATLSVLPWRPKSGRVVRFFCNIKKTDGSYYAGELRHMLRSYIHSLYEQGYGCECGTRSEFYLFDTDQDGNPTRTPHDRAGYLDIAPLDKCENTRREICLSLEEMGIGPQRSCHKYGPGQNEIDFRCSEPVTAADNMVHYKAVVKTIAAQNGLYASFMPQPLRDSYGSALTIVLSMRKDGKSIFDLENGELPAEGKQFTAGILAHMPEMTMFLNPIVNSYSRLRHSSAPNKVCWSFENRGPLVRIPSQVGVHPRIEVRSADCCCNPYISFRLLLAAGMDGIAKQMPLEEALCADGTGKAFPKLPETLEDAYALAKASAFVKQQLPAEVLENVFRHTEQQLALFHAAEDKAAFEEQQYFLSE